MPTMKKDGSREQSADSSKLHRTVVPLLAFLHFIQCSRVVFHNYPVHFVQL